MCSKDCADEGHMVKVKVIEGENGKRAVSSEDLFAGAKEIIIQHNDQSYRLLITSQGKLILNK